LLSPGVVHDRDELTERHLLLRLIDFHATRLEQTPRGCYGVFSLYEIFARPTFSERASAG
jgi:hypothetical protein